MERLLFKRVEVWVLVLVVLAGILAMIGFGAVVCDQLTGKKRFGMVGRAAQSIAELPETLATALTGADPMLAHRQHAAPGVYGWDWTSGSGAGLPGYWIMSHFDYDRQRSLIDMVRLSDGKIVHSWAPDADALLSGVPRTSMVAVLPNWSTAKFKPYHPWLMENGDLIVKDAYTPLLRIDACARPVWRLDSMLFHHSSEPDGAGGLWIPSVIEPATIDGVPATFIEDALTRVSFDGKVPARISVPAMLLRHDMGYLLFPPGSYEDDPVHLNDIQPVLADGPYWKKGDLFVSLRHVSTVLLYRPATDEIVWMKSGPWRGQHDVDILDDHRIAVFDNQAERREVPDVNGNSDIDVYDFATGAISHPYRAVMKREDVQALYEGLYTVLPGGGLVVEVHNSGQILILAADGRRLGQFVNRNPNGKVYEIGWGRYIDQADGDTALAHMNAAACNGG